MCKLISQQLADPDLWPTIQCRIHGRTATNNPVCLKHCPKPNNERLVDPVSNFRISDLVPRSVLIKATKVQERIAHGGVCCLWFTPRDLAHL
jgi:hypothetical protein